MKVLYVTNSARRERPYLDAAVRYRCYNFAEVLRADRNLVNVIHLGDLKMDYISYFDVIVFHKPPFTKNLQAAIAFGEKLKKIIIADYDDLIFDEKNALFSSLYLNGRATEKEAISIFNRNHKALNLFNKITVSTYPLRDEVLHSNPDANVKVIHNGLSQIWVDRAREDILSNPVPGLIGYFSGTSSHNHDWQMVEDLLAEFLNKEKKAKLRVVGPLHINKDKFDQSKLEIIKAVDYEKLPNLINSCWVNIAPLENNLFNSCKSGLKFFEAGILNVPSIVSPIPDMCRFSESGLLMPKNPDEWTDSLHLMMNESTRQSLSKKAYQFSIDNCMARNQLNTLKQFYS
ncbi:glycosyltransferase [Escherichia coli]|uniref:glycosyltransferase n=1 Tax=Escherichia coli TaxID=562 RepID=UPI000F62AAA8|nr:glycosyltransferase [Escherichia coli]EGO6606623.1 glycosyltransferase family 4 protein [Escherichia coli]MBV4582745.1 glycosyltransferase [Escherichia coli]MCF6619262.1 glycosyltransferase [Escherichia coli]MCF6639990.1 glycosyltransferase [Escherichia coli]MCF6722525.1 glycosyltransferase [Escherichia coli]